MYMKFYYPLDITIVGGGMITEIQILPSVFHLQRLEALKQINICALNTKPLEDLAQNIEIQQAFPGQTFNPYPDYIPR